MKTTFTQINGYSKAIAQKFIKSSVPIQCTISFIEIQYKYVDRQCRDNIIGDKLWFLEEDLNSFTVKFENEPTLPPFLSIVVSCKVVKYWMIKALNAI